MRDTLADRNHVLADIGYVLADIRYILLRTSAISLANAERVEASSLRISPISVRNPWRSCSTPAKWPITSDTSRNSAYKPSFKIDTMASSARAAVRPRSSNSSDPRALDVHVIVNHHKWPSLLNRHHGRGQRGGGIQEPSLSPATPAKMSATQRRRSPVAGSPSTAMPQITPPAAPMPVQTA